VKLLFVCGVLIALIIMQPSKRARYVLHPVCLSVHLCICPVLFWTQERKAPESRKWRKDSFGSY